MVRKENNVILKIEGMSCANCAAGIKRHLESKGFQNVKVNFATKEFICKTTINQAENKAIKIIQELGYSIIPNHKIKTDKLSVPEKYFYFTLFFTIPLFCHMFVNKDHFLHNAIIQFLLCLPVYIVGLLYFGKSALRSLKSGIPNMDVLIFIGSSTALIYSIYGWILFNI